VYAEASQTAKIDYSEELKKIIATDAECADIYNQMQDWKDPELRDESAYNFFLLLFKAREIADKLAPEIKIDSDITKYTDNLYGSTGFLCGYISNFPQWNRIAILQFSKFLNPLATDSSVEFCCLSPRLQH